MAGFEPAASTSQMWRDTGLRYIPFWFAKVEFLSAIQNKNSKKDILSVGFSIKDFIMKLLILFDCNCKYEGCSSKLSNNFCYHKCAAAYKNKIINSSISLCGCQCFFYQTKNSAIQIKLFCLRF